MTEFIQITTTAESKEAAQKIAQTLVEQRLVACIHIAGPVTSLYWWHNAIETSEEWTCTAKTRKDLYEAVEQAIRETHSYEVPEIVALPIVAGSRGYLDWIVNETVQGG